MSETLDAYPEGRMAGLEGKESWDNPYSGENDLQSADEA